MAGASLGLSHETDYYNYSPSLSSSCFPPVAAAADSAAAMAGQFGGAAADHWPFDDYSDSVVVPPFAGGNEMSMYGSRCYANAGGYDAARAVMSRGGRSAARIEFRTRSAVEVMDDGFKWRKYGKKAVKSSPNPRNYYRCSSEGCGVKKRVERDGGDPRYVLTTYDGVHSHATPGDPAASYCASPPSTWTWSEPAMTGRLPAAVVQPWGAAQSSESSY